MDPVNITFSSCLYYMKNRHGYEKHLNWFRDFIRVVNRFNLVIYTGESEYSVICNEIWQLDEVAQQKIKVILKPFSEFHNYKYERFWMDNNARTESKLKDIADWRLNMLWCEKTHFVRETIEKRYFDTEYYGWCDIGYFRDTLSSDAYRERTRSSWPNPNKLALLHKAKVYYGSNIPPSQLHNCYNYHVRHFHPSNMDTTTGIPRDLYHQQSHLISGGFYITGREKALWWCWRFQEILERYITNNVVIQDDQHIIAHCVFVSNKSGDSGDSGISPDFCILKVNETNEDKLWFLFRDFLL